MATSSLTVAIRLVTPVRQSDSNTVSPTRTDTWQYSEAVRHAINLVYQLFGRYSNTRILLLAYIRVN
jgi:hypothetical protein